MTYSIPPLASISEALMLASATLIAIGWRLIIKRKVEAHKRAMILGAVFALLFFIVYSTKTAIYGDAKFGGPPSVKPYYLVFLIFHIVLSMTGAAFGIVTIYLGLTKKFAKHRKIGPVTSVIWFCTALSGLMTYLLLYVFYHYIP